MVRLCVIEPTPVVGEGSRRASYLKQRWGWEVPCNIGELDSAGVFLVTDCRENTAGWPPVCVFCLRWEMSFISTPPRARCLRHRLVARVRRAVLKRRLRLGPARA